jgi:hypothetical protein
MEILRRGITGFDTHAHVDFHAFKTAVYAAAQVIDALVVATQCIEGVTPNFHQADIHYRGLEFSVICNRYFPVVAVVERPIAYLNVQPIDVPEFTNLLQNMGLAVVSTNELLRPLQESDLQTLSDSEREQARYWKPQRMVDVAFNWWD